MQWTIFDSQITELDGFKPSFLPYTSAKYIKTHVTTSNGVEKTSLEAGPYVGALPLTNGEILHISPRIGYPALSRMMAYTEGLNASIRDEFQDFAKMSSEESSDPNNWIRILVRSFVDSLRLIEKNSLRTDRYWSSIQGNFSHGKVKLLETVLNIQRKKSTPVVSMFKIKSYNNIENRLLASASAHLLNIGIAPKGDIAVLERWAKMSREYTDRDEIIKLTKSLNTGQYQDSRSYYIPALLIARLILLGGRLTFSEKNEINTDVVLINVYRLFEDYLRSVLQKFFTEKGYIIEKPSYNLSLFTDGNTDLEPDILITRQENPILVLDAKYKPEGGVTPQDFYQMNTYLDAYELSTGVLIRPILSDTKHAIIERKTRTGNKKVIEIHLSISALTTAEDFLVCEVGKILKQISL